MEVAINRKTLKLEFEVTNRNISQELVWVKAVEGFNTDGQTLKISEHSKCLDLTNFSKKYRTTSLW